MLADQIPENAKQAFHIVSCGGSRMLRFRKLTSAPLSAFDVRCYSNEYLSGETKYT